MATAEDYDVCLKGYEYQFRKDLLKGRVAFITGGGSGIGFRIAEVFMRHGCDTVIASRRKNKIVEVSRAKATRTGASLCVYIYCRLHSG